MLFQPSNISPSEINGTGTVDLSAGLKITWQVNGDSPMTKYNISIYDNNAESTLKYSTGTITLSTPFWGVNYRGETQFYAINIMAAVLESNGVTNGNEYKFTIKQWWSDEDYVEQSTASLMLGRAAPTVAINAIASPVEAYSYSFTGTYEQEQGDAVKWVRWRISAVDGNGIRLEPFYDTGRITGTGELRTDYSGFLNDSKYSVRLDIETVNGIEATSGWVDFEVAYAVEDASGAVTAAQQCDGSILITWPQVESAQGYDVFRLQNGAASLEKIASTNNTAGAIRDYSACSGQNYTWYVYPTGPLAYLTKPMVSNEVAVKFYFWVLTEAQQNTDGTFAALSNYIFRYGSGGVKEGSFSNNNAPSIQKNFTRYPARQPDSANYLSGSLSGLIGVVSATKEYSDTLEQSRKLRELSTNGHLIFLRDPKGHFICVQTSQAMTMSVNNKAASMPQTITLAWVEVDGTDTTKITSTPESTFWPTDNILFTKIWVVPETGELIWETADDYANGSVLSLGTSAESGETDGNYWLIQTVTEGYTAATLTIAENDLFAEIIKEEESEEEEDDNAV